MNIALFFDRHHEHTTGVYFERALKSMNTNVRHFWLNDAGQISPEFDAYIRVDHGDYTKDLPEYLRPRAFYVIDTHLPKSLAKIRRHAQHYDWIFCAQRNAVPYFHHASWLPLACDVELHAGPRLPWWYDIGFIGTEGGIPRKFYLQEIYERYPRSYLEFAPHTMISEIYRSCKIVFNYSIRNDINMRVFEALGAGRCLLTNAIQANGLEELFRDREHLVVYHSPRELWTLLEYYLTHDEERERIAQQGRALVHEHHTYVHRVQTILQIVGSALPGPHVHMTENICAS